MNRLFAVILVPLLMRSSGACYGAPLDYNPLAHPTIYLDITTAPYSGTDEQLATTFDVVVSYFKRWDVRIRTTYPGLRSDVCWLIVGGPTTNGEGGVAGQGTWHVGITDFLGGTPFAAYVYADGLGNDPGIVGMVAAHEAGHLLGMGHSVSGVMAPVIDPNAQWTLENIAFIDTQFPVAPVPETTVGTVGLLGVYLLGRRSHRHNRQIQPRPSCYSPAIRRKPSMSSSRQASISERRSCRSRKISSGGGSDCFKSLSVASRSFRPSFASSIPANVPNNRVASQ